MKEVFFGNSTKALNNDSLNEYESLQNKVVSESKDSVSFAEKRLLLNLLQKQECTPAHLEVLKKITGLAELSEITVIETEGSNMKGLELELEVENNITPRELLVKIFLNSNHPEKWYQKLLDSFGYILIRNLHIPKLSKVNKKDKSIFRSRRYGQSLHHDGFRKDQFHYSSALYHGELKDGSIPRQSETDIMDSRKFYELSAQFFTQWYLNTSIDNELPDNLKELHAIVGELIKDPKADYQSSIKSRGNPIKFLLADMYIDKTLDIDTFEGKMAWVQQLNVDSKAPEIANKQTAKLMRDLREFVKDHIHQITWEENTLLIMNDRSVVHGRGFKKDGVLAANEQPLTIFEIRNLLRGDYE